MVTAKKGKGQTKMDELEGIHVGLEKIEVLIRGRRNGCVTVQWTTLGNSMSREA